MFALFPQTHQRLTHTDTARHLGKPFDFFTWLFFLLHLLSYYCWPMSIIRTLNLYYYCTTLSPLLMAQWLLLQLLYLFICHSLCVCAGYCGLGLLSDQLEHQLFLCKFFRYFFYIRLTDWLTDCYLISNICLTVFLIILLLLIVLLLCVWIVVVVGQTVVKMSSALMQGCYCRLDLRTFIA